MPPDSAWPTIYMICTTIVVSAVEDNCTADNHERTSTDAIPIAMENPITMVEQKPAADTKATPYKWIAARIESLDPYKDYEEIVRLSSCYYSNDFINNLMYGVILPTLLKPEWAARAIWREDGGKMLHRANIRVEDTEHYNMTWL